jgi:hypothetical protein
MHDQRWPGLLVSTRDDEDARTMVIDLWRKALDLPQTRDAAELALEAWVRAAGSNDRLLDELERLVVALVTSGPLGEQELQRQRARRLLTRLQGQRRSGAAATRLLALEELTT